MCDGVHGRLKAELRLTWVGGSRILDRVEAGRTRLLSERPTLGAADVPTLAWQALVWARGAR